ncbi:hypothetical protein ACG873_03790 [Mesorhizobium sp. AaZ16]
MAAPAHANELFDLHGESINLGNFHGMVNFTSEERYYAMLQEPAMAA